jgi:2-dehydropantoate 2-reductase
MKIVVVGAGAIGSLYAAKLSSRHDVTVVARVAHADAIIASGLRIVGLEEMTCRIAAVSEWPGTTPCPLILLTTKVNDTAEAAARIAGHVRRDTTVICIQNGLGGEEITRQAMAELASEPPVVLRAITQFGAIFDRPGVIDFKVAGHTLLEAGPRSAGIAAMFSECGLDGRVSERIEVEVWRKLIFNCVINPITSIIGSEVGAIADTRLDPLKRLVIDECLQVARASGVDFDVDFLSALATIFGPSRNIASMRQDLMKGRRTEIDFMNGAVVGTGRRFGIACPVNAALVAIIKAMESRLAVR